MHIAPTTHPATLRTVRTFVMRAIRTLFTHPATIVVAIVAALFSVALTCSVIATANYAGISIADAAMVAVDTAQAGLHHVVGAFDMAASATWQAIVDGALWVGNTAQAALFGDAAAVPTTTTHGGIDIPAGVRLPEEHPLFDCRIDGDAHCGPNAQVPVPYFGGFTYMHVLQAPALTWRS